MEKLIPVVSGFVAIAIMLSIGTIILGSTSFDCSGLTNQSATGGPDWHKECEEAGTQAISGYGLLIIVLIIIAAVAILAVVRML